MGVREHFLWTSWGLGRGMFWVDGHFLMVGWGVGEGILWVIVGGWTFFTGG